MLHVIYCHLSRQGRSSASVDVVIEAFRVLQGGAFNCTLTYFWIQVCTAAGSRLCGLLDPNCVRGIVLWPFGTVLVAVCSGSIYSGVHKLIQSDPLSSLRWSHPP